MKTIVLLIGSNLSMTFAWYGHLKYRNTPLFAAIVVSWLVAFAEYMNFFRSLVVLTFCFLTFPAPQAQTYKLTTAETKDHIACRATVWSKVASMHYAKSSKAEPTFLNLDELHPHQVFTILIWGSDRETFGTYGTSAAPSRIPSVLRLQWETAS